MTFSETPPTVNKQDAFELAWRRAPRYPATLQSSIVQPPLIQIRAVTGKIFRIGHAMIATIFWRNVMYKHLLIATDGSELAQRAVEQGLKLAEALKAKASIITVTEPWDALVFGEATAVLPPAAYEENVTIAATRILDNVKATAEKLGQSCDTLHVKDRFPAEGIVECAAEKGCDLIVMASHGRRGLRRLILGSVANEVVTRSTIPVLICH
jgi:nucleotide-binding universal stress UspA family protein